MSDENLVVILAIAGFLSLIGDIIAGVIYHRAMKRQNIRIRVLRCERDDLQEISKMLLEMKTPDELAMIYHIVETQAKANRHVTYWQGFVELIREKIERDKQLT